MRSAQKVSLALLVGRVPIGLYFLIAGYNKIAGSGVGTFVDNAAKNIPAWAASFGRVYLSMLPFVECLVGLLVILGLLTRTSAMLMSLMLVSFLLARQESAYIHNIVGQTPGIPFDRNWLLLSGTVAIALLGAGALSIDHMILTRRGKAIEKAIEYSR